MSTTLQATTVRPAGARITAVGQVLVWLDAAGLAIFLMSGGGFKPTAVGIAIVGLAAAVGCFAAGYVANTVGRFRGAGR